VASRMTYAFARAARTASWQVGARAARTSTASLMYWVGGGDPDVEPGGELGVGVAAAQVDQGEQGPAADGQPAPSGAAVAATDAQAGGQQAQGGAGHVDAGRVDKHTKSPVETDFLVENPTTRGFAAQSAQLASSRCRLQTAHWRVDRKRR
jgi:hypothetical protein